MWWGTCTAALQWPAHVVEAWQLRGAEVGGLSAATALQRAMWGLLANTGAKKIGENTRKYKKNNIYIYIY